MSKTVMPILVFADGACSGNPGPGGWGAIIVLPEGQVIELGAADRETTNNKMELMAVIRALQELRETPGAVEIYTDSVYVIRGITQWIWGWRKNDWKTAEGKEVANQELWKQLSAVIAERGRTFPADPTAKFPKPALDWKWVKGHSGVPGNDRVDEIGVAFTQGRRPSLYRGSLLQYPVAVHDIPENTALPEMKPNNGPKPAAFSYLSLVGSTPMRHKTWGECERRVKGQSGAKFKKAMSESEESEILRSWGFRREDLK